MQTGYRWTMEKFFAPKILRPPPLLAYISPRYPTPDFRYPKKRRLIVSSKPIWKHSTTTSEVGAQNAPTVRPNLNLNIHQPMKRKRKISLDEDAYLLPPPLSFVINTANTTPSLPESISPPSFSYYYQSNDTSLLPFSILQWLSSWPSPPPH